MEKSLFSELKRIGIDEELAAKVSASLDPDYNASKKDVLVMQEAMMQLQARTDERYYELKTEIVASNAQLRAEMHGINRHFLTAICGMVVTIASVLAINWYYHL